MMRSLSLPKIAARLALVGLACASVWTAVAAAYPSRGACACILPFYDSGESVGTLPANNDSLPCAPWCSRPSIVIRATHANLDALLLAVHGEIAGVGVQPQVDGTNRFVFYGETFSLELDRAVLEAGQIEISTQIGSSFAGGLAIQEMHDVFGAPMPLALHGDWPLGALELLEEGVLDLASVTTHFISERRVHSEISMSATAERLELSQNHY